MLGRIKTVSPSDKPLTISTLAKSETPISTQANLGPFFVSFITINLLKFSPLTLSTKKVSTSSEGILRIDAAE